MLGQGGKDADDAEDSRRTSSRLDALYELDEEDESEGGYWDSGMQVSKAKVWFRYLRQFWERYT